MTIFRTVHNKNYTTINNTICSDKRLSWKAKGIWLYAFSRPDNWKFHINDIINQSLDGRESVRAGLKELEKAGYLVRDQKKSDNGQYAESEWIFYETPQEVLKEKLPITENPSAVEKISENRPLISTDCILNTEYDDDDARMRGKKGISPIPKKENNKTFEAEAKKVYESLKKACLEDFRRLSEEDLRIFNFDFFLKQSKIYGSLQVAKEIYNFFSSHTKKQILNLKSPTGIVITNLKEKL